MPAGVQGRGPAAPITSRPKLVGCKPSTSLALSTRSRTCSSLMPGGNGNWTKKASTLESALKRSITASISACDAVAGRCSAKDFMPISRHSSCFIDTYIALGPSSPTSTVPSPTERPMEARRATRSPNSIFISPATRLPSSSSALMMLLVAKVTLAGEHHDDMGGVGRVDYLLVAHGTARLDHGRHARGGERFQSVGKGKKRVRRRASAPREVAGLGGRDARRHDAGLLTGPHAYGHPVAGEHDDVRGRARADPPRHHEVLELLGRRRHLAHRLPLLDWREQLIRVLHQRGITEGSHRNAQRLGGRRGQQSGG